MPSGWIPGLAPNQARGRPRPVRDRRRRRGAARSGRISWREPMTCSRWPNECSWWNATIRVQSGRPAMTHGQADYHLTKPWMLEQDLYREISESLAEWARDQEAGFDLFHVIGGRQDRSSSELRELLARFNVPFRFTPRAARRATACSRTGACPRRAFLS
jgi:hypothetical protein